MKLEIIAKNEKLSFVQVSKGNLIYNLSKIRAQLSSSTKILCIIKANAYGHDMNLVYQCLSDEVDCFGVADLSEAEELREIGCFKPILVLGPFGADDIETYQKLSLTAVVGSIEELKLLTSDIPFHLEFDTGMGKLGFYPNEWSEVENVLDDLDLKPAGVMTHFATADIPDAPLTKQQFEAFEILKNKIELKHTNLIWHASNSSAIFHLPNTVYNMVRPGLSLFGYFGGNHSIDLRPVLSWKSICTMVRPIKKGSSVSYGATWSAPIDGWLLIIPVGYADGIPRNLSNKIKVNVGGKLYPQVGTVTMDYIMAFSEEPIERGAEVELLGQNSNNPQDWADMLNTIPYEILCGIHPKIKRILVD